MGSSKQSKQLTTTAASPPSPLVPSQAVSTRVSAATPIGNRAMATLFRSVRSSAPPQPGLAISSPNDAAELEADRIAAEVMRMSEDDVPPEIGSSSSTVHRKCATCEDEEQKTVHRSATAEGPNTAPPIVNQVLNQPGQPLPDSTRTFFEPRLGADLSRVRIHTDPQAARSADAVQAKAYTVGNSIAFAAGQYVPHSESGKTLLAHELAHVIQVSTRSSSSILRAPETGEATNQAFPGRNLTPYYRSLLVEASRQLNNPQAPHIVGVLITENSGNIPLQSGGGQGFSSHIEGKATQRMLDLGITRAILVVQREPCLICDRSTYGPEGPEKPLISPTTGREMNRQTPRINSVLPIGTRLIVVGPESTGIYDGIRSDAHSSGNQGSLHPNTSIVLQPVMPIPSTLGQATTAQDLQPSQDRLERLRQAEYILTKYERFLTPEGRQSAALRSARFALEFELARYSSLPNLSDSTSLQIRQSALQRLNMPHEIEHLLTPANTNALLELARIGPHREIYEEELIQARRTGRMSDRGIDALWEFEPKAARQLISRSGMSHTEQRRVLSRVPGQPMRAGTRVMGGALLALAIFQEVAPLIQQQQARNYDEDVRTGLDDILWWQAKGVFPRMRALNVQWFGTNEFTEDPRQIEKLLSEREIDFLALTGIDDAGWDNFTVWATTHLQTFLDWNSFIVRSQAIRGQGPSVSEKHWEYRTARIVEGLLGHRIVEEWKPNPRLTTILQAAARHMVDVTQQQVDKIASGRGAYDGPVITAPDSFSSQAIFTGKPQASAKKMFKPGTDRELYTLANQRIRDGFAADSVFHIFPDVASPNAVPSGYVVVGGADYNTYISIYYTRNYVRQGSVEDQMLEPNTMELLLARSEDLVEVR